MSNQDNKFIKIGSSYSSIGGDKSLQGLQEYLNNPQFYKNMLSEDSNLLITNEEPNIIGENSSCDNETSSN
jgi:hypothetical protein